MGIAPEHTPGYKYLSHLCLSIDNSGTLNVEILGADAPQGPSGPIGSPGYKGDTGRDGPAGEC